MNFNTTGPMRPSELSGNDYPEYYSKYIKLLPERGLLNLLTHQKEEMLGFLQSLQEETLKFSYAEEKWTVAQVLQHLIDTERIFQYRALRIARKDPTPLAGFDQDAYVPASLATERTLEGFIEEYAAVRKAGIALFESLKPEMMLETGNSSGGKLSAAAAGFIIAGHEKHHLKLFKSNYNL